MNREQAKQLLPVFQAFADGETIQLQGPNGWDDLVGDCMSFNCNPEAYRIKPKQLEGWGTIWNDGDLSTLNFHVSEAQARQRVIRSEGERRMFRWVEVTE